MEEAGGTGGGGGRLLRGGAGGGGRRGWGWQAGGRQAGRKGSSFRQALHIHTLISAALLTFFFYPDVDTMRFFPLESAAQPVRPS